MKSLGIREVQQFVFCHPVWYAVPGSCNWGLLSSSSSFWGQGGPNLNRTVQLTEKLHLGDHPLFSTLCVQEIAFPYPELRAGDNVSLPVPYLFPSIFLYSSSSSVIFSFSFWSSASPSVPSLLFIFLLFLLTGTWTQLLFLSFLLSSFHLGLHIENLDAAAVTDSDGDTDAVGWWWWWYWGWLMGDAYGDTDGLWWW